MGGILKTTSYPTQLPLQVSLILREIPCQSVHKYLSSNSCAESLGCEGSVCVSFD